MSGCWKRGWRLELPNPSVTFYRSGLSLACYDLSLARVFLSGQISGQIWSKGAPPLAPPLRRTWEHAEQRRGRWRLAHIARWWNRTSTAPQGTLVQREQEAIITGKNTFLLVFYASATPASGKWKELQLDIWEVLILSSHCGSWDVCGRWSKNGCKSQWIQQKWPQCPPPLPHRHVRVIASTMAPLTEEWSRPLFSRYGDCHTESFSLQKPARASKRHIVRIHSTHRTLRRGLLLSGLVVTSLITNC